MAYSAPYLSLLYIPYLWNCFRDKKRLPEACSKFVLEVLRNRDERIDSAFITEMRYQLFRNKTVMEYEDPGTGKPVTRRIRDIYRSSSKSNKHTNLLFRMVKHLQPEQSVEIGTSLGMSTLTMSMASDKPIATFEGVEAIAELADNHFKDAFKSNIKLYRGLFDDTLEPALDEVSPVNFFFIDGNHYLQPTLHYYQLAVEHAGEGTVILFDDINWSSEMQEAWKAIKEHPSSVLTLDLFYMGIVVLNHRFGEGHYSVYV